MPLSFLLGADPMDKQYTTWDNDMPGLGVRINGSGSSVFVLKYRFQKKQKLVTLCSTAMMTLNEARAIALQVKFLIKDGQDPISKLGEMLPGIHRVELTSMRFDTFADKYMKRHAKAHNKSWMDDERRINKILLPVFGKKYLHEITTGEISDLHYEIGTRAPYQANRVRQLLHVMFKLARLWKDFPAHMENPASGIKDYRERPRKTFLSRNQLEIMAPAINAVKNPVKRNLFWVLILTGCRLNEIQSLRWNQIDFENRIFTVYDTKNGTDLSQPMSEAVILLFRQIQDMNLSAEYVFYSNRTRKHFVNLQATWYRILGTAGLSLRLHDLRRTNGSWLAQDKYSLHLIAQVLNQTTEHVAACYAYFENSHIREALDHVSEITMRHLPKDEIEK